MRTELRRGEKRRTAERSVAQMEERSTICFGPEYGQDLWTGLDLAVEGKAYRGGLATPSIPGRAFPGGHGHAFGIP